MKTIFVIADADDAIDIVNSGDPLEDWEGIDINGVTPSKMTMLHMLLTGDTYQDASAMYYATYSASEQGPWIFPIPSVVIERLAEMEYELETIAEELITTEEFEEENWTLEQAEVLLSDLSASARISVSEERTLFMWMSEI